MFDSKIESNSASSGDKESLCLNIKMWLDFVRKNNLNLKYFYLGKSVNEVLNGYKYSLLVKVAEIDGRE